MGSDEEKAEKKRLKAQYKLEKKRMKVQGTVEPDGAEYTERSSKKTKPMKKQTDRNKSQDRIKGSRKTGRAPWYRDPEWIRALVATVSLVVAAIAIVLTLR